MREPKRLFAERQYGALLAIALTPLPMVAIAVMWATLIGLTGKYHLVDALHRRTWLTTAYLVAGFSMLPLDVLFRSRPASDVTIIGMMLRLLTSMTTVISTGLIELSYAVD